MVCNTTQCIGTANYVAANTNSGVVWCAGLTIMTSQVFCVQCIKINNKDNN
jgi:hypothetical protein